MSIEYLYDPLNPAVPNVIISFGEVDVPTGNPNTLNNPDTSQVDGNIVDATTADIKDNAIIPFTEQQQTAWTLAQQQSQENSTVAQAKAYLTGGDSISLVIQAIIEVLPNTQQQTVQSLTAQILTNIDQLSLKTQQGQL